MAVRRTSPGAGAAPSSATRPRSALSASPLPAVAGAPGTPNPARRLSASPLPPSRANRPSPPPSTASTGDEAALLRVLSALGGASAGHSPGPGTPAQRRLRSLEELRKLLSLRSLLPALMSRAAELGAALASSLSTGGAESEAGLACIGALGDSPLLATELLPVLAPACLSLACAGSGGGPGGRSSAETSLELLFGRATPAAALSAALRMLAEPLPQEGPASARALPLRCLSAAIQRSEASALQPLLPVLIPPLLLAFASDASEVRKCTVFALVDIFLAVGDELRPHLAGLTAAQAKLLDIYIARASAAGR